MGFAEYANYDGLGLAALVRDKQISAAELLEEAIARAEQVNPRINAVVTRMYDQARETVAQLPAGPFAGVPFLLKDLQAGYAGVPMAGGSAALRGHVPKRDSELVRRYRAAGLVIFGKTNTPELGLQPVCEPKLFGPSHTPWKLGHTSGGSSGGGAAAVAAGIVPMAHGADGGGSLRIPAACCGLFGLKPTRGRTPAGPDASELWWGWAVEHGLTRSVRDSAALLDATAGALPGDAFHAAPPAGSYLEETQRAPGKLRVLFTRKPFINAEVHADCLAAVERTAQRLQALGHEVQEGDLGIDGRQFGRDFFTGVSVEIATELASISFLLGRRVRPGDVETSTYLCGLLGRQVSAVTWAQARLRLHAICRRVARTFETCDVILCPTLAQPPLRLGALTPVGAERALHGLIAKFGLSWLMRLPGVIDKTVSQNFSFIPFTPLANVAGLPSMNVPLDWNADGLPIGSMLTGRFGDDASLFRLAAQLEAAHPWAQRRPPVFAGA